MEPVLEVKHVSASYRDGKKEQQVLKDIDLRSIKTRSWVWSERADAEKPHSPKQSWDL